MATIKSAQTEETPILEGADEMRAEENQIADKAPQPKRKRVVKVDAVVENQTEEEGAEVATPQVDFSDDDARLDADSPELDLGEEQNDEQDETQTPVEDDANESELSSKSKQELVEMFAAMLASEPIQSLRRTAEAVKVAFYKRHRAELEIAKKAFTDAGGVAEEFEAPADAAETKLKELFSQYRKKRDEYIAGLERSKEESLAIKHKIIEDLKELISGHETMNNTFAAFRELQQRWREAGPVPVAQSKDIWETYNLYVENFYNFIKINKELRDLDLKKNYEAKLALCEEADALMLEQNVVAAFQRLQKLHEQWRETGPVANEYKESVWSRFKEASARINKLHQDHFEGVKDEQKRNLDMKTELCAKVEEMAAAHYSSRKEWNKASEQIVEIQKLWKKIGFAPKKDNNKIYERFRGACDKFFELKHNFYLSIKSEMEHNLTLKNEICALAESLSASEQWNKTTDELIALQKQWKEVGAVSRRHSDAVWKRFRAACDAFFERKSAHFSKVDSEHDQNLRAKRALLDQMAEQDLTDINFDVIKDYQKRWSEVGYVPIKFKDAISKEYKEVVDRLFNALRSTSHNNNMERFKSKISNMKGGGDNRVRHERDRLYNKVRQLEADIALLENNIGFFSKSKNAEALIADVMTKIDRTKAEMAETIEKVKLIDKENA